MNQQSAPSPSPGPPTAADGHAGQGVLWMIVAMACFVSMDSIAKELVKTHSVVQVVWGRYFFQVAVLAVILFPRLRRLLVTPNLGLQLVRSLLLLVTTGLYFTGLKYVPIAEASAIMMLAPLVVTALSVPLLKERVGPRRWAGVVIGFAGAMIIIRPGGDAMQLAALLPLVAAATHGVYQVSTRFLSHSESVLTTLCYSALLGALIMSTAVPFYWTPLPTLGWGMLLCAGMFGTLGHFALIKAFTLAPAATVAPFTYSNLIWAAASGFLFFGEWPDAWTFVGAAVIVGSGIYIYHREKVVKRREP
ncbi:DMT family transporter [bacterium SCSIO 12827]|nr:DMT family transporter [bacterium SCSIO 12827]